MVASAASPAAAASVAETPSERAPSRATSELDLGGLSDADVDFSVGADVVAPSVDADADAGEDALDAKVQALSDDDDEDDDDDRRAWRN